MENGGLNRGKINSESVITKIKDDGDFDRLRLKVVRKVKDDEELRNSIISKVRQSEALNQPSAKRLNSRQLSDAIYQEVGTKVMSEISDSIWKVIRSVDGMKNEIEETVQSVCVKLLNPNVNEEGQTSSRPKLQSDDKEHESNEINGTLSNSVSNEPPGLSRSNFRQDCRDNHEELGHCLGPNDEDTSAPPPGFSKAMEHDQPSDGADEDPDVPPGFA